MYGMVFGDPSRQESQCSLCFFKKGSLKLAKAKTRIKVEEQLTKPSLCYFQSCLALGSCLGIFVINPQHFRVCTASVLNMG